METGMLKRVFFAVLLLTVGFVGGLVLTGHLQSAAFSEGRSAGPETAPGGATTPLTDSAEQAS